MTLAGKVNEFQRFIIKLKGPVAHLNYTDTLTSRMTSIPLSVKSPTPQALPASSNLVTGVASAAHNGALVGHELSTFAAKATDFGA